MPEIDAIFGRCISCFDASLYVMSILQRQGYSARIARGAVDAGQDGIIVPHYWLVVHDPECAISAICDPTISEWLGREFTVENESVRLAPSADGIAHIEEPGSQGLCASREVSPGHATETIDAILAP